MVISHQVVVLTGITYILISEITELDMVSRSCDRYMVVCLEQKHDYKSALATSAWKPFLFVFRKFGLAVDGRPAANINLKCRVGQTRNDFATRSRAQGMAGALRSRKVAMFCTEHTRTYA